MRRRRTTDTLFSTPRFYKITHTHRPANIHTHTHTQALRTHARTPLGHRRRSAAGCVSVTCTGAPCSSGQWLASQTGAHHPAGCVCLACRDMATVEGTLGRLTIESLEFSGDSISLETPAGGVERIPIDSLVSSIFYPPSFVDGHRWIFARSPTLPHFPTHSRCPSKCAAPPFPTPSPQPHTLSSLPSALATTQCNLSSRSRVRVISWLEHYGT